MAQARGRNLLQVKHLDPDSLTFTLFTSEDIRNLCVTKICTPLTFDALGYPLPGGLYDKTLGPMSEKSEPCGTCYKNFLYCPGHFGYIELPLPVVNPLFHNTLASILKLVCLECFYFQIPGHIKHCLSIQMKLLNNGFITEAIVIESKLQMDSTDKKDINKLSDDAVHTINEYERYIEEKPVTEFISNKNTETLRAEFINNKVQKLNTRKVCIHCKHSLDRIQTLKNKIILSKKSTPSSFVKAGEAKFVTPEESRRVLREIWKNERGFLCELVPVLTTVQIEHPTDVFFFDVIPVTPNNVRPVNFVKGKIMENDQTQVYKDILQNSMLLRAIILVVKCEGDTSSLPIEAKEVYSTAQGKTPIEKLNTAWDDLQTFVNCLVDKEMQGRNSSPGEGLKQIIEKKAGLIRMHMMGKRVNFSARSVITPDPNLNVDEIGIPEEFAKSLTYPVPVTAWNVAELRKMILNGPKVHPGAVMVEYEDGSIKRINEKDTTQQEAIVKRLLTPDDSEQGFTGVKKVYRHLCNGDILLLNRQPTLHKPSIMAHTARILRGEKTLRLHYANCKAYNADFDGDEMNAHFPQNELARSEGYTIANVSNQYLVPKDGTPLSGLIQDHVISGVRLTMRGKFFSKDDYQQLVYQALAHKMGDIILLPPTIIKPIVLWSGKQVLSTVIINIIPAKQPPINLSASAKINAQAWETCKSREWQSGGTPFKSDKVMSEAEVIIRNGELLVGVLDKTHYGATPYGLVHCMYELYGGTYATKLLSSFAKLFTYYLQHDSFTLGVQDILVLDKADKRRHKIITNLRKIGKNVVTKALDISIESSTDEIVTKIEETSFHNPKMRAIIDREYKVALDSYTNDINKTCLPAGLISKFPHNNLQLMVQSGAKGSTVNTMQISCLLGQIELEGKRPPVMISGKSLPSFPIFEFAPRAGGFIDGRFMTGIQPQEFFFHCMAGREGLIDTAVKTSRSGYLQRCLIKHLEGLTIGYDLTVRDSDSSVIQFLYGEDGMDVSKAQFLNSKQIQFLYENRKAIIDNDAIKKLQTAEEKAVLEEKLMKIQSIKAKTPKKRSSPFTLFSELVQPKINLKKPRKVSSKTGRDRITRHTLDLWQEADDIIKNSFKKHCLRIPDPLNADLQPDIYYGALTDHLVSLINEFKCDKKKGRRDFEKMLKFKAMQSLCSPGEPVGLLAAQSIGEPSTQMTLNTFHFAGRGEMNVTLGIPRLREILMMASKSLKTPSMEIPFLDIPNLEKTAEQLRKTLTCVTVADVLEKIDVDGHLEIFNNRQMVYKLKFHFLPHSLYKSKYNVKPKHVLKHMTKRFFSLMFSVIRKYSKSNSYVGVSQGERERKRNTENDDADNNTNQQNEETPHVPEAESSSDEEPEDAEDAKLTSKHQQMHEDQEPEEEEKEKSDNEDSNETEEKLDTEDDEAEMDNEASNIVNKYSAAKNYTYDKKDHLWCEITFGLPLFHSKLDLTAVLRETAKRSVLWETPNIRRAITYMKDDRLTLRTDGINLIEMFKYSKILDLNKLYSNDIHSVAQTYGIEAAAKVIVKEVQEVFKVYGITVDPRHLLLIADYMTFNGTFLPLSRTGMNSSASPLQQMSFEASLNFLKAATVRGKEDHLKSPSSCLIVGKPCNTGTGSFTLLQKIPLIAGK